MVENQIRWGSSHLGIGMGTGAVGTSSVHYQFTHSLNGPPFFSNSQQSTTPTKRRAPTRKTKPDPLGGFKGSIRTACDILLAARKTGLTSPCKQQGAQNTDVLGTHTRGSHIHMERSPQLVARHPMRPLTVWGPLPVHCACV